MAFCQRPAHGSLPLPLGTIKQVSTQDTTAAPSSLTSIDAIKSLEESVCQPACAEQPFLPSQVPLGVTRPSRESRLGGERAEPKDTAAPEVCRPATAPGEAERLVRRRCLRLYNGPDSSPRKGASQTLRPSGAHLSRSEVPDESARLGEKQQQPQPESSEPGRRAPVGPPKEGVGTQKEG